MASSLDNKPDQDGLCSVYSAQPSETNCSISESLAKEITAVNELPDDAQFDVSAYSTPKSETNVTVTEGFRPCNAMNQFNLSVRSAQKSETNVTMREKFEGCKDLRDVLYSVYSVPPSETNVTIPGAGGLSVSQYTALPSETNATMAEGFRPCHAMKNMVINDLVTEYTAKSGAFFHHADYVAKLQLELGIPDNKMIGLEGSNGLVAKIIDSNECLLHLEQFQPIPVDFSEMPEPIPHNKSLQSTNNSVESYLLRSKTASSVHHEI